MKSDQILSLSTTVFKMPGKKNYKVEFGSRYVLTISEFKGNLYTHLRDTKIPLGEEKPRYITLHSQGVLALEKVLPEVVKKVRDFNGASQLPEESLSSGEEEEGEEVKKEETVKNKKRKRAAHGV